MPYMYLWSAMLGSIIASIAAWRFWPARSGRMSTAGVLGGIGGAAVGLTQPTLFLAENGIVVTLALYSIVGGLIGLILSSTLRALVVRTS